MPRADDGLRREGLAMAARSAAQWLGREIGGGSSHGAGVAALGAASWAARDHRSIAPEIKADAKARQVAGKAAARPVEGPAAALRSDQRGADRLI
jgi:hypothetical protein